MNVALIYLIYLQGLDLQKLSSSNRIDIKPLESTLSLAEDSTSESVEVAYSRAWDDILQWTNFQIVKRKGENWNIFIDDLETLCALSPSESACFEYLSQLRCVTVNALYPQHL